jgi:ubiquitin-conjugating enzyme E2 D
MAGGPSAACIARLRKVCSPPPCICVLSFKNNVLLFGCETICRSLEGPQLGCPVLTPHPQELEDFDREPLDDCSAAPHPAHETDLSVWDLTLIGPENSPYRGGIFELTARFPETFPSEPPTFSFKTKIFHPNITAAGHVSLNVFESEGWSSDLSIKRCIRCITELLAGWTGRMNTAVVATIANSCSSLSSRLDFSHRTEHKRRCDAIRCRKAVRDRQR